jgi:hypothetical protein
MPSTDEWKKSPKSSLDPRIDPGVTEIDENCSLGIHLHPGTHKAQLEKEGCRGRGCARVTRDADIVISLFGLLLRTFEKRV